MKLVWVGVVGFLFCLGVILLVMKAWRNSRLQRVLIHDIFQVPFATGDLILANLTPMVPEFTRGAFHHTGIIYVHPGTQQIFVWHTSRYSEAVDPFVANFHPLHMFCRVVKNRKLGVRKLLAVGAAKTVEFPAEKWLTYYQKHTVMDLDITGRVFSQALKRLPLGNHLGKGFQLPTTRDTNTLACVDLTTLTYVAMGVLSARAIRMNLLTEDFCGSGRTGRLPFENGFSLGPEFLVSV